MCTAGTAVARYVLPVLITGYVLLCRGSQYRVESMLVRLAHTQNYLTLTPSREQVRPQRRY
jgi:hypothetical protein